MDEKNEKVRERVRKKNEREREFVIEASVARVPLSIIKPVYYSSV